MEMSGSMSKVNWNKYKQAYILTEENIDDINYLFRDQLDKVKSLVKSLREPKAHTTATNKVIAISGERGSGKSSLLGTIKSAIEYDNELKDCWVIGVIDPNEFSDSMGILELILTRMYNEIKEKKSAEKVNCQNELTRDLLRWLDVIAKEKNSSKDFYAKLTDVEILDQFNKRLTIVDEMGNLFERAWKYKMGKDDYQVGNVVLLIDDLDLVENKRIYKMLEEIKQVLSVNVVTIISYRPKQLLNSIQDAKLIENKNLLKQMFIDEAEVTKQATTYSEKLVPRTHLIQMPRSEEVLNKKLEVVFKDEDEILNDNYRFIKGRSIIENIYHAIEKLVLINIKGIHVNERSLYEASFNLRTVIQTYEFIIDILKKHDTDKNNLLSNVKNLRDYFYQNSEDLLYDYNFASITRWLQAEADFKNYYIYQDIYNSLINEKLHPCIEICESLDNLLNINRIQAYNISLGDIVEIIEEYKIKTAFTPQKYHYIYVLKIMYSLSMLESLITEIYYVDTNQLKLRYKYIEKDNNFYFSETEENLSNKFWDSTYYKITRYKIVPESIELFRLKFKKQRIYIYEKLVDYNLLDKVLYSNYTSTSEIKKIARHRGNKEIRDVLNHRYRIVFEYRNPGESKYSSSDIYRLSEDNSIENNRLYDWDIYTYFVKEQYLNRAIDENLYVFYSMFDIDILLTKSYDRVTSKLENNIMYMFNKLNRVWKEIFSKKENLFVTEGIENELLSTQDIEILTVMFKIANTPIKTMGTEMYKYYNIDNNNFDNWNDDDEYYGGGGNNQLDDDDIELIRKATVDFSNLTPREKRQLRYLFSKCAYEIETTEPFIEDGEEDEES